MPLKHYRSTLTESVTLSQNTAWQPTPHASTWSRVWKGINWWPFGISQRTRNHARGHEPLVDVNRES